jgi:hypothetical protein
MCRGYLIVVVVRMVGRILDENVRTLDVEERVLVEADEQASNAEELVGCRTSARSVDPPTL